jgi:hypothetical protein
MPPEPLWAKPRMLWTVQGMVISDG